VSVSCAGASNVASSGAASVTVVGRGGMGMAGSSAGARVGHTACQASAWASSSGVVCKAPGGLLRVTVVIVSAGVLRGSASALVSYDAVSVSGVGASNAASSGGTSVTVVGRGGAGMSGASSKARVGLTACDGSVWLSDSGLVCRSASGRQAGERVVVSSGVQHGSVSVAVSYNAPVVSGVGASNAASSGGRSVTVVGSGGLGIGRRGCGGGVDWSAARQLERSRELRRCERELCCWREQCGEQRGCKRDCCWKRRLWCERRQRCWSSREQRVCRERVVERQRACVPRWCWIRGRGPDA